MFMLLLRLRMVLTDRETVGGVVDCCEFGGELPYTTLPAVDEKAMVDSVVRLDWLVCVRLLVLLDCLEVVRGDWGLS